MKSYLGVKQVMAVAMMLLAAQEALGRDIGYKGATDEKGDADGYLVQYADGYQAWSPKQVFEDSYRQTDNMNFGLALEALKKGLKVGRLGWNGKGIFIYIPANTGEMTNPFIAINTTGLQTDNPAAPKCTVPWLASQTDMLADDWVIVE